MLYVVYTFVDLFLLQTEKGAVGSTLDAVDFKILSQR
jgi:hypothetical protein